MPKEPTIKTTGQLRAFLTGLLAEIKNGSVELDRANNITKMASQINQSFNVEIKIAKIHNDLGKAVAELGALELNGGDKPT